jgi:hypothetical protein
MAGRSRLMALLVAAGLAILALVACSKRSGADDRSAPAMSERQRDSAIARSRLPGGGTVGRALAASDTASARAARIDSLFR